MSECWKYIFYVLSTKKFNVGALVATLRLATTNVPSHLEVIHDQCCIIIQRSSKTEEIQENTRKQKKIQETECVSLLWKNKVFSGTICFDFRYVIFCFRTSLNNYTALVMYYF